MYTALFFQKSLRAYALTYSYRFLVLQNASARDGLELGKAKEEIELELALRSDAIRCHQAHSFLAKRNLE